MNRPLTATGTMTAVAVLSVSLLVSGCGARATTAEDPAAASSTPSALTKPLTKPLPIPTGSPLSKDAARRKKELARREAEAQAASPPPTRPQQTGEVPIDDTLTMTYYMNRKFVASSAWRLKCGDWYDTLAVGAVDGAGYVIMGRGGVHGEYARNRVLAAPDGVGRLSIVSARCDGVRVRDRAGRTLTYRPATNSWAD